MNLSAENVVHLRALARDWRNKSPQHASGIVLIWQGEVYGWKDALRNPEHEKPGALAIDHNGHIFVAEGGNSYDGAKHWKAFKMPLRLVRS